MDKADEMIRKVFAAGTLHECGFRLEKFARWMEEISDPNVLEEVSEQFWTSLNERSAVSQDFEDPENRGWTLCPPTSQIATYLDISLVPQATPEEDIAYLLESGQEMQREFDGLPHLVPDMGDFQAVMSFLDMKYDYSSLVLGHQKAIVMLFPDGRASDRNQCVIRFYSEPGKLCPHFPFFGKFDLDRFMELLVSPVYRFVHELSFAMLTSAFGVYVDDRLEHILPPEIVQLAAQDHAGFEHLDPHSQVSELDMDILKQMLADSPFPAPLIDSATKQTPNLYQHPDRLLDTVLGILARKRGKCQCVKKTV